MAALTMRDFRARFAFDVAQAGEALLRDGFLAPMFAITPARGQVIPVAADFGSPRTERRCRDAVRILAVAEDAVMAMHWAEAWMAVGPLPEGVAVSESERRTEAVIVVLEGRLGREVRRLSSVREIVRGADGRPSGLRVLDGNGDAGLEGPIAELLPPRRPTPEQRMVARAVLERMRGRPAGGCH